MRLLFLLLVGLFMAVSAEVQICKYMQLEPPPPSVSTLYKCTEHAVQDRICATEDDYYEILYCEHKSGGAVNILLELGFRYLFLGDAYSAHYLQIQP